MACANCGTSKDGKPGGCQSNGGCATGGCNRMNTYDWLATLDIKDNDSFDLVEVSFKNGSRKGFYHNPTHTRAIIGDMVVVQATSGYDIGHISLTGELVRLQMKKKRIAEDALFQDVIRVANQRDLEKLREARDLEKKTMVRARVIARTLDLDMKVGDVEYQGDKRKATFYYTAEGRVDFRELIRHFAKEFKVKIEMRQIGARQESARIGGLGSCGRELCCSTWLTDFKSVSTAAARYQNLAINQSKLSGQCGRLKCCLNYELDSYLDALQDFPKNADVLKTEAGTANLIKTDIFKRLMYYVYNEKDNSRAKRFYTLSVDRVKEVLEMNKAGEFPVDLVDLHSLMDTPEEADFESADLVGVIELPPEERRRRKKRRKKKRPSGGKTEAPKNNGGDRQKRGDAKGPKPNGPSNKSRGRRNNRGRGNNKNRRGPKKD